MAINFNVDRLVNSFDAPNIAKFLLIPVIIVYIISLIITLVLLIPAFKRGGIEYKSYDSTCEDRVKRECDKDNGNQRDFESCYNRKRDLTCESTIKRSGIWAPVAILLLVPVIIAFMIGFAIYRIALYFMNPKLFAATVAWRGFTGK